MDASFYWCTGDGGTGYPSIMLAVSTGFDPDATLPDAVTSMRELEIGAVALHRPPRPEEIPALAGLARNVRIVAVFEEPCPALDGVLAVLDGGPAGEDREVSLEALCRRLHLMGDLPIALRSPKGPEDHPSPSEIELIGDALRNVGYWHVPEHCGPEFLEAAGKRLFGASFHPLSDVDLVGLRDALPSNAPVVVACPAGTAKEELREAVRLARGVFRA